MRKLYSPKPILVNSLTMAVLAVLATVTAGGVAASDVQVSATGLGVQIPTFADILTFIVRGFFVITGLVAMLYLFYGAFSWVTSGGKEDKISEARSRIQAAIVGVILVFAMLAVVTTLEQVVFARSLCFGLSCPASIPGLAKPCVQAYASRAAFQNAKNAGKVPALVCCNQGAKQSASVTYKTRPLVDNTTTTITTTVCAPEQ